MSRNLTKRFLAETSASINQAISIADILRIAHLSRVPCGYHVTKPAVQYTADDLAWFRRRVTAIKGIR